MTTEREIRDNLRRTIDQRLVSTVFQPIVGLQQAGIIAYEALTRPAPESGFDSPDQLFDAAEAHDLIWELECVTRRAALEAAADWPAGVQLFLNATPQVIADERFTETILAELDEVGGLVPNRIVLEVTERSENRHVEGLQRQTALLQRHEFKIAIDDVGAGTSGLNRIMLLRPQWLKLDRALITNIDQDPVRTNLIRFLAHFGRLSGVSIIAEGLERVEELERVVQLGVDAVQGYLLGKPGSADRELAPDLARTIASSAGHGDAAFFLRDKTDSVLALAKRVEVAAAESVAGDVADVLNDGRIPGVAVLDRAGSLMWCPRDAVATLESHAPLLDAAVPFVRTLDAATGVDAALETVATDPDASLDAPLAVTRGARLEGVCRVRDLLRAGSELCRVARRRSATLTGLPGRVRCEQQLQRLFREDAHREVAFIDIRNLGEYNAVFGFELGDQLITSLVAAIEETVRGRIGLDAEGVFLGHLGDDRLMLIADPGIARRVARPSIALFENKVAATGISPSVAISGIGAAPAMGNVSIRYLIVPAVKAAFTTPQAVMRTEPVLRAMADEQAAIDPTRSGYIVEAPTDTQGDSFMVAA
jgi:EAL domain-containing protein (putative c-di-GMP-specific phosphodiesterase class I)/GGDEF domain-containing protein